MGVSPYKHQNQVLVNPAEDYVHQFTWEEAGSITAEQAALAVDARDDASVEALDSTKKVKIVPNDGTVALEFRFRSDADDDAVDSVLELYAAAGDDHYTRIAQLTIKEGLQEHSTGIFFADSITEALNNWISDTKVVQPSSPDDHIARYVLNAHGYDRFLFIASDLDSTTIYVDVRRV